MATSINYVNENEEPEAIYHFYTAKIERLVRISVNRNKALKSWRSK